MSGSEAGPGEDWDGVAQRLSGVLGSLDPDEFVVLGEPAPDPGPPRGLLRRRPRPAPTRYVQYRRSGGWLQGECVGATLFGGGWEVSPTEHEQLRELGWRAPGDPDDAGDQPPHPNYWRTLPREQAGDAAAMGAAALRLLGADPGALVWQRDR